MTDVKITTPFIKLEQLLKLCGAADSGGHAKMMILQGEILANGKACFIRGKKLYPGDVIEAGEEKYKII